MTLDVCEKKNTSRSSYDNNDLRNNIEYISSKSYNIHYLLEF